MFCVYQYVNMILFLVSPIDKLCNDNHDEMDRDKVESFVECEDNEMTSKIDELTKQLEERQESFVEVLSSNKKMSGEVETCLSKDNCFTSELDAYIKLLKQDNDHLRIAMENSNVMMKKQIKNLHEWQEQQAKSEAEARRLVDELKKENHELVERVKDLEGHAGLKLVEEMTFELASLRSKLDEQENEENKKTSLESEMRNLASQLTQSEERNRVLAQQVDLLQFQLGEKNEQLKSVEILQQQVAIYEKDFKLEEMAKLAALKEIDVLEKQIELLKSDKTMLEEKIELGNPTVELKADESSPVGQKGHHSRDKHSHRTSRRAGKL